MNPGRNYFWGENTSKTRQTVQSYQGNPYSHQMSAIQGYEDVPHRVAMFSARI